MALSPWNHLPATAIFAAIAIRCGGTVVGGGALGDTDKPELADEKHQLCCKADDPNPLLKFPLGAAEPQGICENNRPVAEQAPKPCFRPAYIHLLQLVGKRPFLLLVNKTTSDPRHVFLGLPSRHRDSFAHPPTFQDIVGRSLEKVATALKQLTAAATPAA
jgi:hypothetical protein